MRNEQKIKLISLFITRFVLFTIVINSGAIISVITLHEIAHTLTARYLGCPYSRVILNMQEIPRTDIICQSNVNIAGIALSALAVTSVVSLILFLLLKGVPKYISLNAFSVGIIAASIDLNYLVSSQISIMVIGFAAYLILALSTIRISLLYFEKHKLKLDES
jgi:hypothetical protein